MGNKKTAWFNEDILPSDMVKGATGEKGWVRLEYSDHFKVLNGFIQNLNISKMADIGCGAGELGRLYPNINYVGFDLPHIIDKVGKVVNPNLNYHYFDADDFDYSEFKNYDILICNGFISELTKPFEVISNLLENTECYLLIHRQRFSNETIFSNYNTYGDLPTTTAHIGYDEFTKLLKNHEIINRVENVWGDTILIKKK